MSDGVVPTSSNLGQCYDGHNYISPNERKYKGGSLYGVLRAMYVVDVHILNFCLGFSTGRYIYFWNVLKENLHVPTKNL